MMQNYGYTGYYQAGQRAAAALSVPAGANVSNSPRAPSVKPVADTLGRRMVKVIKSISFQHERKQLLLRFPQLSKWLGEPND